MATVYIRFYAALNDFLAYRRRQVTFAHAFDGAPSVKDVIESLGVPHIEVALILVSGQLVDFNYHVIDGDHISVYPAFGHLPLPRGMNLQALPGEPRFVCDVHLGRLAAYLRMLGFDTLFPEDYRDEELARISDAEDRILLTRDVGLLKRSIVRRGAWVRATEPWTQLEEIIQRFDLYDVIAPMRRCAACNGLLEPVEKAAILDRLPEKTAERYDEFRRCTRCGRIYWRGSHFDQMDGFIARLLRER
jgi:uncharacterized protein with PIN domain